MKTLATVTTTEKAIEVLQEWLSMNINEENLSSDQIITDCTIDCECGETQGMKAFFEGIEGTAYVAICEQCGVNDDINLKNTTL